MADASKLSATRTRLYTALQAAMEPTPWRVHRTPPVQLAAPLVYIGAVRMDEPAMTITVEFPVTLIVDGADGRQVEQQDDITAVVVDAIDQAGGRSTGTEPLRLDTGGPTLRATVTGARFTLTGATLCTPQLQEVI